LRKLGEDIEPLRARLPIKHRDDDLIAYTQYPPQGATALEVRYNRVQPFQWAWVVNLLATCVFGLYVIGIRRKGVFHLGMALLMLGLVVAAYGFYMRVAITGWAPVTNMYETVIFVPFFVAMLGTWFALLPVTWDGLRAAWRLTGVPGTWEASAPTKDELRMMPAHRWTTLSALLIVPRIALSALVLWVLAIAPYSAGGRTIINLLPNVDAGQSLPDFNDLMTWGVGLLVLAPSVWYLPRVVLSAALSIVTIPLTVQGRRKSLFEQTYARWPFCLAATFIAFFGAALASFAPVLDGRFSPLQPVLRDNFWLLIHVLTIVSSYGAGALAWALANIALGFYLFGRYQQSELRTIEGHRPAREFADLATMTAKRPPEQSMLLAGYTYKAMQVAVVLLAAGTILGALWADVAWGRFWGWDPKEVWALISLLVYLAILHGRYAGMFGNFGLCVGSVLGFSAIVMSWYGVNFVLGVGLHSYGFGQGGQWWVFGALALNWLYLLAASIRYNLETRGARDEASDAVGVAEPAA
jgi:ABC-type transport system involved in cytochrome c biogenesis permease subunit